MLSAFYHIPQIARVAVFEIDTKFSTIYLPITFGLDHVFGIVIDIKEIE
jgi:hypothetical protein